MHTIRKLITGSAAAAALAACLAARALALRRDAGRRRGRGPRRPG